MNATTYTNAPTPATPHYKMKGVIAPTRSISPAEMERTSVARFKDLQEDPNIFADIKQPGGTRRHFHVISENNHIGPARITGRHHFHMSYLEVPPGSSAMLHAHDAAEIFIPISGRFAIIYGDDGEHQVDLEPLDTISVPIGVMRTFKNIGNVNGVLMVLYDGVGDVLDKIFIHQRLANDLIANKPDLARDLGLASVAGSGA